MIEMMCSTKVYCTPRKVTGDMVERNARKTSDREAFCALNDFCQKRQERELQGRACASKTDGP